MSRSDCRKFQPNIFNKTKCTNCFRQREEHSAQALESNRASRKVSKCGYLFVAPDWDFSIPLNRTKRWQRRWFVLYDDGELTYSVDDHPATIPQGVIDMNRVLEVSQAEDVTGNQFSLAITAPDRVTFIKGTCREESRWWMDVLSVFPRSHKQQGRHKRNATFPGIKTTTVLKQNLVSHSPSVTLAPTTFESPLSQRVRFHSCTTDPLGPRPGSAPALDLEEDVFPTKDSSSSSSTSGTPSPAQPSTPTSIYHTTPLSSLPTSTTPATSSPVQTSTPTPLYHSTPLASLPASSRTLRDEHKENTPPYNEDYTDNPPTSESPPTQDKLSHKFRTRRAIKREVRGLAQPRSEVTRQLLLTDLEESKREEKLKDIADSITRLRGSTSLSYLSSKPGLGDVKPTRERDSQDEAEGLAEVSKTSSEDSVDSSHPDHQVRGDPDGLEGSAPYTANPDLQRVDLPAEDLLYIKKGWLMKQSLNHDWIKYWFVLRGTGLTFYRDPSAEDNGILDGIIDLSIAKSIEECDVARNYGFMILTWEEKKYVFSAVTSGIRGNWVQALRNAANLKEAKDRPLTLGEQIEREIVAKKERPSSQASTYETLTAERDQGTDIHSESVSSPSSRFVFSSDEEYRTASETSGGIRILSKALGDCARSRSNSRSKSGKRSRSSPPSSRRNTRDDFPSLPKEELVTSGYSESGSLHSISDLESHHRPEKDGSTSTIAGSGEALLVDLLETQVETLKAKLEQTQADYVELHRENSGLKTRLRNGGRASPSNTPTGAHHHHLHHLHHLHHSDLDLLHQSPPSRSRTKLERSLAESRATIASLTTDLGRFRKKLEVCEGDLDRSEHEVDKLRRDKEEMISEGQNLRHRVASLENQIKELLDRVEEQEHDLSEKASCVNQLNELRKKYGELQEQLSCQSETEDWKHRHQLLEKKVLREHDEWEQKCKELTSQSIRQEETVCRLTRSLQEAESRIQKLVSEVESEKARTSNSGKKYGSADATGLKKENQELVVRVEHLTNELVRMRDSLKSEKSEVYKWKDLVKELRSLLDGKNEEIERKRDEVESLRDNLRSTQRDLDHTADRLHQGIEENESLCGRIRELERDLQDQVRRASSSLSISSSRERFSSKKNIPRIESITDLTNFDLMQDPEELDKEQLVDVFTDLRMRFEKAVNEIKALKKEMRDVQNQHDDVELSNLKLRQDLKGSEGDFSSQLSLMTCRIQDLTNKLSMSEKQVRLLKQKLSRAESRDRRRTQSLKGRESFALSKDMEAKLAQLESKVSQLLLGEELPSDQMKSEGKDGKEENKDPKIPKRSRSFDESTKSWRLRRKSLDSPSSSEAMKAIVRLNALETKVSSISGEAVTIPTHSGKSVRPRSPTHPASPIRSPMRSPSVPRKALRSPRATPEKTVKVTRSDSETKALRDKVANLEKVLSLLEVQLGECVSWAGSIECVCSCGAVGVSSLLEVLKSALVIAELRHTRQVQAQVDKLRPLTLRLQDMLRDKLTDLNNRRDHLKAGGKWTRDMQLKLFAERLAYETLVLTQVSQVLQAAHRPNMYEASTKLQDLIEAHRKLSFLEKKLTNPDFDMETMAPLDFYTSLLAEKLVVQGEVAASAGPQSIGSRNTVSPPPALGQTCKDLQARLLERERSLAHLVTQYKEGKLHEIAVVMARETVTGVGPTHDDSVLLEEVRMREVWAMAQDLLNQELVNMEAAQSLMRLGRHLMPGESNDVVSQTSATTLERWHTAAEESLRQEMEEAVFTLSNKYEAVLAQYRVGDTAIINSVSATMDMVLSEFAAIVAQKAVIDGQLAVVQGDGDGPTSTCEQLNIVEETRDMVGSASDVVASEAHLLMFLGGCDSSLESLIQPALDQAEFTFMFNKMIAKGGSELTKLVLQVASQSKSEASALLLKPEAPKEADTETGRLTPTSPSKALPSPKAKRKSETSRRSRRASDITGMADGCRQCEELRQEVNRLKKNLDSKRMKEREAECKQCLEYLKSLKSLEQDHRLAMSALQSQHEEELSRLREQSRHEPPTRDSDDELTELKRRLCLLEEGYEAQITALKKQYEDAIGSQPDMCEEKVRQRYQVEIEHLRGLCEKGLGAMENSHKRMLTELEEKHRRELAALQAEKDQALAEETQATLAALDAMRKAHEAEVQREIAKFKEEFIRKMQSGHDIGAIHKEHEAEMEDIRHEILSLSQKYSIKCLESASLEEKVDTLTKQLADSSKQVVELEARNKQLKVHLTTQVSQLKAKEDTGRDTSTQLRLRESELALRNEEIARLTQQLQQAHSHEVDLGEMCRQLGHFLKAERQLRTDEVTALREKLEHIILTAANMQEQRGDTHTLPDTDTKSPLQRGTSLSSARGKELMRSPSCPRLSGFSSFLAVGPSQGGTGPPMQTVVDLPSPLAGMVASRKKVFETSKTFTENM